MRMSRNIALNGSKFNTGHFLALTRGTSPYLDLYTLSGDEKTLIPNAITPVNSNTLSRLTFTPDGMYLFRCLSASPYMTVYKRNGNSYASVSLGSVIDALPTSAPFGVVFSGDGNYMVMCLTSTPFVRFYKKVNGLYTNITVSTMPTAVTFHPAFTTDGVYCAILQNNANVFTPYIYKRSGDTFTRLSNPTSPNAFPTASVTYFTLSPDGQYIMFGLSVSPFVSVYKRDGDTWVKLAVTIPLMNTSVRSITINNDSTAMVICGGYSVSPYQAHFYSIYADSFTYENAITGNTTGESDYFVFSKDGKHGYLLLGNGSGTPNTKLMSFRIDNVFDGTIQLSPIGGIDVGGNKSYISSERPLAIFNAN